mmetsp:Transcript_10509/g.18658  ORF Transcript_10509/g.18658 Transcript_10509/m.18658 type:complete len:139 (-) Transcript_10509:139-555(-)
MGITREKSNCSLKQMKSSPDETVIKNYNKAINDGCSMLYVSRPQSCSRRLECMCTVNRTSMEYRKVYKFSVESNCTKRLERLQGNSNVTGKILQWNIADLFDVQQWHFDNHDCSHVCYILPLYEAAFERLGLLLPPLD